ncbi:MAG: hypothetical protein HGA97_10535 [Chlorobiaceae bacterium]|nr:hypothetical protein [Chlorobiaceae bacterium]
MRQTIRGWHLQLKSEKQTEELSKAIDPVLRGGKNYFCRFNASAMSPVWHHVNLYIDKVADAEIPKVCKALQTRDRNA